MKQVIITILTHKEKPTDIELKSVLQACKILKKYNFAIVIPNKIDDSFYKNLFDDLQINYTIERFGNQFFGKISRYNKFQLNKIFYQRFLDYKYVLIYHFDSFVFRDELEYWCNQGYDYIGAPWPQGKYISPYSFRGYGYIRKILPFFNKPKKCYVGNGGFTLKNVKISISILQKYYFTSKLWSAQEDYFWAYYFNSNQNNCSVPSEIEASRFSTELESDQYYLKNGSKLPFGSHAYEKYSTDFWEKIIRKL